MKKLFNLCSLFLGVIGSCAVILVGFILFIYPNQGNKNAAISSQNIIYPQEDVVVDFNQNDMPQPKDVESQTAPPEAESVTHSVPSGTYTMDDIEFWFSDSVRNDTTGRWRISSIASSKDIVEYAADYYNTFFSSNDEIHAIVNFSLNTTTSISVLAEGLLDVAIHEYIDGEEHDAKALFGGMLLKEYFINLQTGEIEEIQ